MPCHFDGEYHDHVWGTPVTDSKELFAQLSLASQQAGVSWRVVWNKRLHYCDAFHGWDMRKVAAMTDADLDALCDPQGEWAGRLMQNRSKLNAIIHNAKQCALIEDASPGGLAAWLWRFVAAPAAGSESSLLDVHIDGCESLLSVAPSYINACESCTSDAYTACFGQTSELSERLAAVLRQKGAHAESASFVEPFKFLGSITLQAFMLQVGLLNGHAPSCCKNPRCATVSRSGGSKRARGSAAADKRRTTRRQKSR